MILAWDMCGEQGLDGRNSHRPVQVDEAVRIAFVLGEKP